MRKIEEVKKENDKKIFADKWGFARIFMLFVVGCIIGVLYEEILNIIRTGSWETRKGVIYGPFNPVYGFGFALFAFLLGKNIEKRKWYLTYIYACLIGGATEFSLSFIQEVLFQTESWDYSGRFLNICGRTTVPYMLGWGLGGLIFMLVIYPFLSKLISKIPYKVGKVLLPILVTFMSLNMFLTYTAMFRWGNRVNDKEPITSLGLLYDNIYPDHFMEKNFPLAVKVK